MTTQALSLFIECVSLFYSGFDHLSVPLAQKKYLPSKLFPGTHELICSAIHCVYCIVYVLYSVCTVYCVYCILCMYCIVCILYNVCTVSAVEL